MHPGSIPSPGSRIYIFIASLLALRCCSLSECSACRLHRASLPAPSRLLTGRPGCCHINHHISIHHCLLPAVTQTWVGLKMQQTNWVRELNILRLSVFEFIHVCERVCVFLCRQMAPAGLTVCELSPDGSTCKEKQEASVTWTKWLLLVVMSSSSYRTKNNLRLCLSTKPKYHCYAWLP